ncbi:MAG: serine/threonine-protein kinase, partial [Holophaga sp.]|nr:serine/threonine-protein kinase [Holophaga sp.]
MELPNSLFGSYRLLELLGEGGMGRVWKAVDVRLERVVALKILKGDDEDRRRALIAEAKTACQLQHPNIAVVYEAGVVEGVPFIAMEYVEGQSLASSIGKPMGVAGLLNLAIQACKALHHAHSKGVIHRDIKPDNLVLTPDGVLKVLDFGVAKRNPLPSTNATVQAFTLTHETEAGISVGTPAYMSPEQVFG